LLSFVQVTACDQPHEQQLHCQDYDTHIHVSIAHHLLPMLLMLRLSHCHSTLFWLLLLVLRSCRCFGVPLSALFGLKLGMSVRGFWLGLLCTTYSMSAVQLLIIARFNWPREVERAAALLASHANDAADEKAAALGAATAAGSGGDAASLTAAAAAAAEGSDTVRGLDVWPRRTGRSSKDGSGRHGMQQQQTESDQERVSLLAGTVGGNSSSELTLHLGAEQQQQVLQHQVSLQRGLLQSCDSVER
jgi:hypothetical protein